MCQMAIYSEFRKGSGVFEKLIFKGFSRVRHYICARNGGIAQPVRAQDS